MCVECSIFMNEKYRALEFVCMDDDANVVLLAADGNNLGEGRRM